MHSSPPAQLSLRTLITDALLKDQGPIGDVTTLGTVKSDCQVHAQCVVKDRSGIISGMKIAQLVFEIADPAITFQAHVKDGDFVRRGDIVATLHGSARGILAGERTALEFLRRMSGIATKTREFVEAVAGTRVTILDTRKTLPGYGELDKQAVRDGGGINHRANLSEMGLIKNNHIDLLDSNVAKAIRRFRIAYPEVPLEVETRNEQELVAALTGKPDRILLDNMTIAQVRKAVKTRNEYVARIGKKIPLEASGNMTLTRVREVAKTGVEYISVGALTHAVEALDLSLHITLER